jgi:ABC-2 type transport system permease protein
MRRALIIAKREYRQHLRTKGFWIGLLLIPVFMVAGAVVPSLFDSDKGGDTVLLADLSGRFQPAIERALEREYQKTVLRRLSIYAQEYDLHPAGAPVDWGRHSLWYSDAETERFIAWGGIDAALALLQKLLPARAQAFEAPHRLLRLAPFPNTLDPQQPKAALDATLPPYLRTEPEISTDEGPSRVVAATVLPAALGPAAPDWQIWTNGGVAAGVIQLIAGAVQDQGRGDALRTAGIDAAALAAVDAADLAPHVNSPRLGGTVSTTALRQLIPVGCAWMLWMTIMMVSNILLHGVIEERSDKLIESLLATVTADELMIGKLLGVAAIGFTIALTWTGFAIASVGFAPPDIALVLRPALEPYASIGSVFSLVFYFVTGYLAIATLFLVIGSMCDSMHDAQAYLAPLIVVLLAPLVLSRSAMSDPHGLLPIILSWIPIYTPFAMLGRLGTGVSTLEIVSSGVLLLAFVTGELIIAGRIFRASLLRAGQPPKFSALVKLCFARGLE